MGGCGLIKQIFTHSESSFHASALYYCQIKEELSLWKTAQRLGEKTSVRLVDVLVYWIHSNALQTGGLCHSNVFSQFWKPESKKIA
jgi:hypothetical protein